MENNVAVGKYVIRFGIVYLLLLVGLVIIFELLGIESNSGVGIGALMGAAIAAAYKFVEDNKRIPTPAEKAKLVWLSFLASWVVSFLLAGIYFTLTDEGRLDMEFIKSVDIAIPIGVIIFISVFHVLALYITYGYLARKQFEGLQKKGKI